MPEAKTAIPRPYSNWNVPSRYEIRNLLGVGSYGHVCEAVDGQTKKKVAVKRIPRAFDELIDCKRVLRETALLRRLSHGNCVKLIDVIIPGDPLTFDELFLVLELADSDLKKLVKSPVDLTEMHVKMLLYNLLVGLKYVHSAGIYHRDLKPANCLVNQNCCVKVCDFGLARTVDTPVQAAAFPGEDVVPGDDANDYADVLHDRQKKRLLTSHVVTRWYRAPELILLQEDYTAAIDVWSVGCIFAELLGMMKENVRSYMDRSPLFPGSSCFPLSPDRHHQSNKHKLFSSKTNRDQLAVILDVIGSPTEEEISALSKDDAKRYVRLFPKRNAIDLRTRFPGTSPEGIALLQKMLTFDPKKRITVEQALQSSYFKEVRDPRTEVTASAPVKLPFDDWGNMTEKELRYAFLKEAQHFHPELKIPAQLEAVGYSRSRP